MKPNFLEIIDINKKFGNINALKNVSLNVSKGEVICIIGPSGCGKSTLLRTVNWLTPPDSGKVILKGEIIGSDTAKMTLEQNRSLNEFRARIGMVFQQFNVWPHLNALENVVRAQIVVRKRMRDEAEKKAIADFANTLFAARDDFSSLIEQFLIEKAKEISVDFLGERIDEVPELLVDRVKAVSSEIIENTTHMTLELNEIDATAFIEKSSDLPFQIITTSELARGEFRILAGKSGYFQKILN